MLRWRGRQDRPSEKRWGRVEGRRVELRRRARREGSVGHAEGDEVDELKV